MRPFLVIVRAGDSSLHPTWLSDDRNWDLIVNYYGDDPDAYRSPDVVRIDSKGPKWRPLRALIEEHWEMVSGYHYVWLPDDDLAIDCARINEFFRLCARYGLELAQPALTVDSYVTHPLLVENTACFARYTNFVEVMAPCFSAALLKAVLPTFGMTESGWGIDWLWPRHVVNPETGIAVVDAVTMRHTRPVGGPNYEAMRQAGRSPRDELLAFEREQGISSVKVIVHGAVWRRSKTTWLGGPTLLFNLRLTLGSLRALLRSRERLILLKHLTIRILRSKFSRSDARQRA